ncbi:MAG: SDR family NAD(P)-dependent oxidoreductase, partial [Gammaproteobacteria bacterium]
GKTTTKLEAVYDSIVDAGHPEPAIYPMNLEGAQGKDYVELTEVLDNEFGKLDGLVLNAAKLGSLTPIEHFDDATWMQVMQVNLNASYLLTKFCLPVLAKSGNASVIYTTDKVASEPRGYWGAYAVSKAGQEALAQIVHRENGKDGSIRVNTLDPGEVRTRMRTVAYPGLDPNDWPLPEDVMGPYLYLLGPDSTLSGERIVINE